MKQIFIGYLVYDPKGYDRSEIAKATSFDEEKLHEHMRKILEAEKVAQMQAMFPEKVEYRIDIAEHVG